MPLFHLTDDILFPHPSMAEPDGLLAIGGDLSIDRLLLAYRMGIFPWFDEKLPILWWSPDPRLVLFPSEIKVSRSLRSVIKKGYLTTTFDNAFERVIRGCAYTRRPNNQGTWITADMIEAYTRLHIEGYAHSVEIWFEGRLVGGLYGVAIGKAFFGESMFSIMDNASKVALTALSRQLAAWDFKFIDCQVTTPHLVAMGARHIAREEFLKMLNVAVNQKSAINHRGRRENH